MNTGLQQAINIAGSQTALAQLITNRTGNRVCHQAVQQWCAKGFPPIKRVPDIVKALGGAVKPAQLRPDFFQIEQGATQEPQNGCTDASGDNAAFTRPAGSTIQEESYTREDAHVGDSPIVG